MTALAVQARFGAEALSFSETLEAVIVSGAGVMVTAAEPDTASLFMSPAKSQVAR